MKVGELTPDIVFMDVRMPGMNGIEATKAIRLASPTTRVILFTVDESRASISEAIQAGVSGYLLKDASADELVNAARLALEGKAVIHPQLTRAFIEEVQIAEKRVEAPPLSRREKEILQKVAYGATTKEVAHDLDLAPHGEDAPRADLREARRQRPRAGRRDRDQERSGRVARSALASSARCPGPNAQGRAELTNPRLVAPCRGPVVQHPCPGAGARVRRSAAKTGWNPALSRNREAPSGDESGRLLRGANDGPRRKGGLWAARTRPIAAPSDRKEGGWANLSASSWRSGSRCRSRRAARRSTERASGGDGASPTSDTSSFPVTVEGTNGEVGIDDRPVRIVSLSPTATEDLFAIGAGEQVIAVDDQSNFPPELP